MKIDKQLEQRVGTLHGVRLFLRPSSILGSLLLWLLFRRVAARQLGLEEDEVKTAASLLTIAHWLSDLLHQLGHARAARQVGYPMSSIRLMHVLAASTYPKDEPPLPPETHIHRAWGGVKVSLFLTVVLGLLGTVLRPFNHFWGSIFGTLSLHNLLTFTLGALIPTPIIETDGNSLIKWYRAKRQAKNK